MRFRRSRQLQQFAAIDATEDMDIGHFRFAFRQRAGLVENERIDLEKRSMTSPPFTSTPYLAPLPMPATFDTGASITRAPGRRSQGK